MTISEAAAAGQHHGLGHWGFVVVGALWIVFGAVQAVNPAIGWRMRRWQYRNPEAVQPSDRALTVTRVVGVVVAVVGIALVIGGIATA